MKQVLEGYGELWRRQGRIIGSVPDFTEALANVGLRLIEDLVHPPNTLTLPPKTIFNVSVSNQRSFATSMLPLSEVKAVAKTANAKVNDVVMAVCAGALRRYLQEHSALPKEPLIAAVPVSLREPGNVDSNTQVTMMLCNLATDLADPLERLAAITNASQDAKARLGDVKSVLSTDLSMLGAPIVLTVLAEWFGRTHAANVMPAMANVLIANVPGSGRQLYCVGTRLEHYFPLSALAHGCALNITAHGYLDHLDFGLLACRDAVPDLQSIATTLVDEFNLLTRAARLKAEADDMQHKKKVGTAQRAVQPTSARSQTSPDREVGKKAEAPDRPTTRRKTARGAAKKPTQRSDR